LYILWHDRDYDLARWVYLNSKLKELKEEVLLRPIPKNNSKKNISESFNDITDYSILPIIKFENPDLIIQHIDSGNKSKILFVAEFMTHTPQHHHPLQRFTRIYSSSNSKIPVSIVMPMRKEKLEKNKKGNNYVPRTYSINPLIYDLYVKTNNINHSPALIFFWPDKNGYLRFDKKHPTAPFIDEGIKRWFYFLNKSLEHNYDFYNDQEIKYQFEMMKNKSNYNCLSCNDYIDIRESLYNLGTITVISTEELVKEYKLDKTKLNTSFFSNEKTLIFSSDGLNCRSTYFRVDPYAGMFSAFDNLFCRDSQGNRKINLVLKAKDIEFSKANFVLGQHDKSKCPFLSLELYNTLTKNQMDSHLDSCPFVGAKQQRIYGQLADVIIFDDEIFYHGDDEK